VSCHGGCYKDGLSDWMPASVFDEVAVEAPNELQRWPSDWTAPRESR
jgi:hypothetical protein